MKEKSKAFNKFKQYKNYIKVQTGKKLKVLRVDGGGEYLSKEFKKFLLDNRMGNQTETCIEEKIPKEGVW